MFICEPLYGIHLKQNLLHNNIGVIAWTNLESKSFPSLLHLYDDLAGKTNRSRNELIGLALDYAKDKIIVEE